MLILGYTYEFLCSHIYNNTKTSSVSYNHLYLDEFIDSRQNNPDLI